jgi:hypothetical protein
MEDETRYLIGTYKRSCIFMYGRRCKLYNFDDRG